jgi:predicted DNA-binding transcriptional regulator AlpA
MISEIHDLINRGTHYESRPTASGWLARCPAHNDRSPSLSISEGDDGHLLLHCHKGCTVVQIRSALDARLANLMLAPARNDASPGAMVDPFEHRIGSGGRHDYCNMEGQRYTPVIRCKLPSLPGETQRKHFSPRCAKTDGRVVGVLERWLPAALRPLQTRRRFTSPKRKDVRTLQPNSVFAAITSAHADVATTLRVSTWTVWKMVACGDLPPPLKIGGARRWRKSDVQSFIEKLAAERDKH